MRQILEQVKASQGEIEIGVSVVTVAELVHGVYRAKTPEQQQGRLAFIERLCQDVPVHPVTLDIARLAGRIEGQARGSVAVAIVRRAGADPVGSLSDVGRQREGRAVRRRREGLDVGRDEAQAVVPQV